MPSKLGQILSIELNTKRTFEKLLTSFYHASKKPELFVGFSKSHAPFSDKDEKRSPENKLVSQNAKEELLIIKNLMAKWFDVVAQKDATNCIAKADILVGGTVFLKEVPVSHILFLEKRINEEILPFIAALPILPLDESWEVDSNTGLYVTKEKESYSRKAVKKAFQLAAATDKHPAQVQMIDEDQITGTWTTKHFSGALPKAQIESMRQKAQALLEACKFARQQATFTEAVDFTTGSTVTSYIFG